MKIGNLGQLITFSVSSKKILTFETMNKTVKGRWTAHTLIGKKPRPEFLGADRQQTSLEIQLSSEMGVNPRKIIEKIEKAVEKGTPLTFVVGGKKIGKHQWVIESMSETWDKIILDGKLVSAKMTLTLSEYM